MAADRSTDPFSRKLQRCLPLVSPQLQHAVLDYDRLRSHIKRIAFYTQPDDTPHSHTNQPTQSDHLLPPSTDDRRSSRHSAAGATKERARRYHDLFWTELRRQVEVMNTAYGREEKECRRLLAELGSSESMQQQRTAEVCRYLAQHCSASVDAAAPIRPPMSADLLPTFHSALRLCSSLSALSHFLFVSYLVLWRAVGKYNKHTESAVDQRQLAAFPSSPFTAPPRLSSLLSKANALFALQSSSSSPSTTSHCPLCLLESPHVLHLPCHSLCFNCCVRQPSFGAHCPQCRREEDVQADSVEVGHWVSSICRLRVDDSPASRVKVESAMYSAQGDTGIGGEPVKRETDDERVGSRGSRMKERKLTVKVGDIEIASFPPALPLTFPPSPLSANSTTSSTSYLSSPSTLHAPPHLPPSPGPNASPTSSTAFDEFFALHYRPKRGQGVSCHQCKTNKDPGTLLFCANREEKGVRRRRCRKKYCESCLRRSYPLHVLVREDGRDWHCPSCVGVCCCAACQRKESPASTAGSDDHRISDSPPVISLTHASSDPANAKELQPSSRARRDTSENGGKHDKRVKRESNSNNHLSLTSPMRLSFCSSSPPLTYYQHTMPSLEPLSSPISPDSISNSLSHSSPAFSSLPDQPPPNMDDWERSLISTLPGAGSSATGTAAVHHAHVRPLMPPPPANSLLAAINAPTGLLHPMHQELDARRATSAPPDAISRSHRHPLSGMPQPPALPTTAHDVVVPLNGGHHQRSARESFSMPGAQFDLPNPFITHSHSQPLPHHSYSTSTSNTASHSNASQYSSGHHHTHSQATHSHSASFDFTNLSTDSFLSIQSLASSPVSQSLGGANGGMGHYSYPDISLPLSGSTYGEVDGGGGGGLKGSGTGRSDDQLWSAVDDLFAP